MGENMDASRLHRFTHLSKRALNAAFLSQHFTKFLTIFDHKNSFKPKDQGYCENQTIQVHKVSHL